MKSSRLNAIVEMVPTTACVADIGCDHGKVAVSLLSKGKAEFVICTDISQKSLEKARKLAGLHKLGDAVTFRQGDGLRVIKPNEAGVAVIAGMGGELIADILEDGGSSVPQIIVLSCNSGAEILRKWLCDNCYVIEDEELIFEGRHYYPVILAKRGKAVVLSDIELEIGPVILKKKPKVLNQFIKKKIQTAMDIRENMLRANEHNKDELIAFIDDKLKKYSDLEV